MDTPIDTKRPSFDIAPTTTWSASAGSGSVCRAKLRASSTTRRVYPPSLTIAYTCRRARSMPKSATSIPGGATTSRNAAGPVSAPIRQR